jgi:hypothetical protein
MVQFFGTTYVIFDTDRKNDTLRNETNSIKEQENGEHSGYRENYGNYIRSNWIPLISFN